MDWVYRQPVEIHFGIGKIHDLKLVIDKIYGHRGLLVIGNHFWKSGFAQQLMEESGGRIVAMFHEIAPNPDVEMVDACAAAARSAHADFILAVGGGSVLDCAKAAAVIALTENSILDYYGTALGLPKKHLPLIAVPTTSGTGSEVTSVSVISDYKTGKKLPVASDALYPDIAVIDPALTVSLSPQVTASTGIDVLSHALEGYWSKGHQPVCDSLAVHAGRLVFEYLVAAYEDPKNLTAREKLSEAAVISGMAFNLSKTTASHACSFPLTNLYKIPHGEACGMTLDYFARINGEKDESGRINQYAKELGFEHTKDLADGIFELKKKIGLRTDLKEYNLSDEDKWNLVYLSKHPNLQNNPVEITDETLYRMYDDLSHEK